VPAESVSLLDAYTLPVLGSVALYGLYLAFAQLDKVYVNYALTAYFGLVGVLAMAHVCVNTLSPIVRFLGLEVEIWHLNLIKKSSGKNAYVTEHE
jgi:minor histocompatibility antigen H13